MLFNSPACISFNGSLLKKQGVLDEELTAVLKDPAKVPLEENDRALFIFVMKGISVQASATPEDIEKLLALGWRDSDVVDAVQYEFSMYAPGKILELFQMI